jgi:cytoskeletal protein CcmA (bactofilin family)
VKKDPRIERIQTALGAETGFSGNLGFKESLSIQGRFNGEIRADGFLFVGPDAEIDAEISVGSILIAGKVRGSISALESVEIISGSEVHGNIRSPKIKIEDGVIFNGKTEMIRHAESIDIFSAALSKLKSTLQSV